jgi:hypothetical protein
MNPLARDWMVRNMEMALLQMSIIGQERGKQSKLALSHHKIVVGLSEPTLVRLPAR